MSYARARSGGLNEVSEQNERLESEVQARTRELWQSNEKLKSLNGQLKSLNEQLMQASVTDSLTGLKNSRFLDEFIDTEVARVNRCREGAFQPTHDSNTVNISPGLFCMMIDLDGFKGINLPVALTKLTGRSWPTSALSRRTANGSF